jgi:hypothetical protein
MPMPTGKPAAGAAAGPQEVESARQEHESIPVIEPSEILPAEPEGGGECAANNAGPSRAEKGLRPGGVTGLGWQPGQSGNPSGRRKQDPAIIALLKDNTLAAAQTLIGLMNDPHVSPRIREACAEYVLDRVYGKATQPIDATVGGNGDPITFQFLGVLERWSQ